MSIFKWSNNPFFELERVRNQIENAYNSLSSGVNQIKLNYTGVFPLVNIYDDDEKVYVTAELPGVSPEALDVSVKGKTLTLRGETEDIDTNNEVNFHRTERQKGQFRRNITLPFSVNPNKVSATYKNGVLKVSLQKTTEEQAHKIEIKS